MPESNAPQNSIILYQAEDGRTRIECRFESDTIWLTQALMAELFQVTIPTVNEHLKGIFSDGELDPGATIRKFRIVRQEGSREVSREMADEKAAPEYEAFSARRRAEIESREEEDAMKQLEEAAKKLPDRKKPRPKKQP